jgi:hypothetical protein
MVTDRGEEQTGRRILEVKKKGIWPMHMLVRPKLAWNKMRDDEASLPLAGPGVWHMIIN